MTSALMYTYKLSSIHLCYFLIFVNFNKQMMYKTCRGVLLRDASIGKGAKEAITGAEPQDNYTLRVSQGVLLI